MIIVHQQPSLSGFCQPFSARGFLRPTSYYVIRQPHCRSSGSTRNNNLTETATADEKTKNSESSNANAKKETAATSSQQEMLAVTKESEPAERVLYSTRRGRVFETKDHYCITYDLPGVKEEDVQIRLDGHRMQLTAERKRANQQTVAKYSEAFVLDRTLVDTQDVHTELEDGVLTVTFSKKEEAKPFSVPVHATEPPATEDSDSNSASKGLYLSIDVPGVKASDATVEVNRNRLSVHCERKRQRSGASKILRQYEVDPSAVDLSQLHAYLLDGVLTLLAPARAPEPAKTLTVGRRSATELAAVESTEDADEKHLAKATTEVDDGDKKEYEVVVETADDEE